ncbi:ATP-dependent helicase [Thermocrispum sp.]|uniref:ATP-dependent helicase n=1 Tax=Thermocrispum sp. TaxID=2060768 RepID=UPI00257F0F46|nr:ATP-dependent helicase [Thermocrispum sp.]
MGPVTGVLELFSAPTRAWFSAAFPGPTAAQEGAWRAAAGGGDVLVIAPTGSGKTLAAFLLAVDRLASSEPPQDRRHRCRVLYVSPLKALAVDVQRNLREPLEGIAAAARKLGAPAPEITVGMRTGDTPSSERARFTRSPSDILVTTPESLYLLLTSNARESLRGIRTVIVDEVHAVAGNKRGAHLALSLERLDDLLPKPAQRIGLSATVRPVDEVATFLSGGRPVEVVQPPTPKTVQVTVEVPVEHMTQLPVPEEDRASQPMGSELGCQEETVGAPVRRPSIWPSVERRIYELVTAHRSTIVFTNSRRLAERLTTRLNELHAGEPTLSTFPAQSPGQSGVSAVPPPVIAKAHHGSMSREQRLIAEEELKAGTLPCVVATSSLELGIDMGAVDLVIQVEPPPTVASGLQRIGRAGHHVGAVSTGVMFPKQRGELPGCAVVAERMAAGRIESLRCPRNPLDVLAQQIVAMVAAEQDRPLTVSHVAEVVRRAAPYRELPDDALHAVLDMLSGRYPSTDFAELRPRITWDRATGELRARPGARRLAVTSGGTIPDRGLYTVVTAAGEGERRTRVGELDEEMVHESRVGDTILLGTSAWRITDITPDQVVVVPAPGQPARMPFWKGETVGRPLELGKAIGAFVRELAAMDEADARERAAAAGLTDWAVDNLLAYLAEQRAATGHIPDDRTIVIERYRDELGDWRVVVHSPFGAQVNAPWALAISAALHRRKRLDAQVMHSDDGIVLRLPDVAESAVLRAQDIVLDPDLIDDVLRTEVSSSALFAARFRECAARALLLPRRDPRRRQPLWQQRQRAGQLLSVAADYDRFPVVLEAMRECLQDVYDVAGLRSVMRDIAARAIRVVEVQTQSPSPFARSLLFGYVGEFLYNSDAPLAERRAAALALDSALLAELLGSESLRELLDADVIADVEADLQHVSAERHAHSVEAVADLLRTLGDLTPEELAARGVAEEWITELERYGRAMRVTVAGQERVAAVEDAARLRDGLGVTIPAGVPAAFLEPVEDPVRDLLVRFARRRGPFTARQAAERFGLGVAVVERVLDKLAGAGVLVRGQLHPAPADYAVDYCDADVLRRIRRACLARMRAEVEPVDPHVLGAFLPAWHGIGGSSARSATADDLLGCVEQLAGAPVPASALESLVLPARLPGYTPALLDELTTSGEVTWCGCGTLPGGDGWVALAPSDVADLLLPDPVDVPTGELHTAIVAALDGGALFFRELVERLHGRIDPSPTDSEVVTALWDLVWAGVVTGDSLNGLRAVLSGGGAAQRPRRTAPRGRYARMRARTMGAQLPARPRLPTIAGPPTVSGRWALVPQREQNPTRRAHARTESFLERHGVLTRGSLDTERVSGGFAGIYQVLRQMAETGQVIRGYVIDGLGGAQFAVPGAIDRLRAVDPLGKDVVVLSAADPAQPYGAALPWPAPAGESPHRPGRKAGAVVVLVGGRPALYLERGGKSLLSFTTDEDVLAAAAHAVADLVRSGRLEPLTVRRADGEQALTSELAGVLRAAGFRATPQGLRLR